MLRTQARALLERAKAARDVALGSGILGTLNVHGAATLVRRVVERSISRGPTAVLTLHAAHRPHDDALIDGSLRLSYQELERRVDRLTHALLGVGVRRGDKIAVMMKNGHRYLLTQWAAIRIGAVVVQIGYRLKSHEIAHILTNAEPAAFVHDEELLPVIDAACAEASFRPRAGTLGCPTQFDELLAHPPKTALRPQLLGSGGEGASVMVYTSGTTGRPKGAARSLDKTLHDSLLDFLRKLGVRSDERHLVVCPLYHSAAPVFVAIIYGFGGCAVLQEGSHFDPEAVLATIERERITSTLMVPTMLTRLVALPEQVRRKYDTSSLRWIMSAAAPLPTETARRVEAWLGPVLYNFYGATETGLVTLAMPGDHTAHPGTVGRPLLGNEIRLLDDDGREVPRGEVGELFVRNSMLVGGYHRDRDATSKAMRDGFFSVGDMARVDADGFYYLADRKNDMVISGGVNIYPWEIEQHLHTHPGILEAAVIGVPDAEWGETLRAFVVRRAGFHVDAHEVQQFCKQGLADYKMPRSVIFLDHLPRLPTGKVLKRELRQL